MRASARRIGCLLVLARLTLAGGLGCGSSDDDANPVIDRDGGGLDGAAPADAGGGGASKDAANDVTNEAANDAGGTTTDAEAGADAGPSGLDPTFASGGLFQSSLAFGHDYPDCVARQSNGGLVVVGHNDHNPGSANDRLTDIVSYRLDANGALDPAWGAPGTSRRVTHVGRLLQVTGCVARPDDTIDVVAAATLENGKLGSALLRLSAKDGALDPSLGGGIGYVVEDGYPVSGPVVQANGAIATAVLDLTTFYVNLVRHSADGTRDATFGTGGIAPWTTSPLSVTGLAVGADDLLLGLSVVAAPGHDGLALTRFTNAGAVDTTFGTSGSATLDAASGNLEPNRLGVDGAGRIVVSASASASSSTVFARFTSEGALDTTFGSSGLVTADGYDSLLSVAADGSFATVTRPSTYSGSIVHYDATGALDTAFGTNGVATTALDGQPSALVRLANGGFLLAGGGDDLGPPTKPSLINVAAVTVQGAADTTFGTNGLVTFGGGPSRDWLTSVVVRPDGKIVAAGTTPDDGRGPFLVRLDPSGALDPTFGIQGIAENLTATLDRIALTSAGQIVGIRQERTMLVSRITADGAPDPSFGDKGLAFLKVPNATSTAAHSIAVDAQDRVLVGGTADNKLLLARATTTGALDATFGTDGALTVDASRSAQAVAVRADGKIVAAGGGSMITVVRCDDKGVLDSAFAGAGSTAVDVKKGYSDVYAVLPVSGGGTVVVAVASTASRTPGELVIARFTDEGAVDATFGTGGVVTEPMTVPPVMDSFPTYEAAAATIDGAGRIVVGTRTTDAASGNARSDMLFLRYTAAGVLDTTFGSGGRLRLGPSGGSDAPVGATTQLDGRVLFAGHTWSPTGGTDMALLRLP